MIINIIIYNYFLAVGTYGSTSSQPLSSSVHVQRPLDIPHKRPINDDIEVARSVHEVTVCQQIIKEVTEREVVIEEPQVEESETGMTQLINYSTKS
jgi:hypothetical protein